MKDSNKNDGFMIVGDDSKKDMTSHTIGEEMI